MRGTGKRALWLVIGFSLACGGGSAAPVAPAPTAAPASPSGGGGGGGGGATASTAGAATAGSARASDWDGKEKFYCGGNENKLIRDVTTTLKDEYVIEAAGLCKLRIENSKITGGAYAVYATGMAEVTIVGGELHGTTNSIYATGEAKVHVDGTYLDGPTEKSGAAIIDGPGPRKNP